MKINVLKLFSLDGHHDCVYALETGESENLFYSAGGDGMIVEWDLKSPENGQLIAKMNNSVYALCRVKGEQKLIAGQNFEGIHCLDLSSKKELWSVKIANSQFFDVKEHEGRLFVAAGNGTLYIVDMKERSIIQTVSLSDKSVRSIAINARLGEMALGLSDNSIRILDLNNFKQKYVINAHKLSVFSVVYHPLSNVLISAGRDAHVKSWNSIDHYSLQESIPAHMYAINSLSLSPDSKFFVSGSMDKTIKVWDLEQLKLLKVIDRSRHAGHVSSVNKVLWTPYKNQVVTCSDDKKISIWDLSQ